MGIVSKKTLTFLDITTILLKKIVTITEMKKVTMIHGDIFFRFKKPHTGLSQCGGRQSGGGGGIAEASRSVKPIDICKILNDLCKK
jgi:hypothetical protein